VIGRRIQTKGECVTNTHRMLYNSSFSINDAKGCHKEQRMKHVDYESDNNNQRKLEISFTHMRQQTTWIYKNFKRTNLKIALKVYPFLTQNYINNCIFCGAKQFLYAVLFVAVHCVCCSTLCLLQCTVSVAVHCVCCSALCLLLAYIL
jgi:hypothetical protein